MESSEVCDMACEILRKTNDGEDLDPRHLKLLENAVNGFLNELGEAAFKEVHAQVTAGKYQKPWYHDIENLTRNHQGYILWKGMPVEHFSYDSMYGEEAKTAALEVARRCRILEGKGVKPTTITTIWNWEE